jgi:hypothetical protein
MTSHVLFLERLPVRAVSDGELVVLGDDGKPDFPLLCECVLQRRSSVSLTLMIFDLLDERGPIESDTLEAQVAQATGLSVRPVRDYVGRYLAGKRPARDDAPWKRGGGPSRLLGGGNRSGVVLGTAVVHEGEGFIERSTEVNQTT